MSTARQHKWLIASFTLFVLFFHVTWAPYCSMSEKYFFLRLFIQILNCLRHGCESGSCSYILATMEIPSVQFSSVTRSCPTLRPHGQQHARPLCLSPTPPVDSNSIPLSQWCHTTSSSSVIPFSSALNLSQHQGLFKWVSSSHQLAKEIYINVFNQFCW